MTQPPQRFVSDLSPGGDFALARERLERARRRFAQAGSPKDASHPAAKELKAALSEMGYAFAPWNRPGHGEPQKAKEERPSRGNAARNAKDTTPGPWKAWRRMSRHGRAIKFIQTYVRTPKGVGHGKPMRLAGFQKEWLEETLADGVDSAVNSFPRGNGKSTFGAAVGTWGVFDDDDTGAPQVPIVATTVGQAIRSCYGVAAQMVAASPDLADRSVIYTGIATPRIWVPFNNGEMFPISNDIDGLQGLDPTIALCDEIGFQPVAVWDALLLSGGKRPRSLVMGFGTPGLDRLNALFHLRRLVLDGAAMPGFVYREYAADPDCRIDDVAQWRKANPALRSGFLNVRALRTALAQTPESSFRIFRLGQWVDGVESWLGSDGRGVWDAGEDRSFSFVPGAPTWVGVDAAITRDTTAVVAVQQRPDERLHAVARIWVPTKDEPVDLNDVMAHIRDLATRYAVRAVAFDPRFMDWPAKVLFDEDIPMVEVPQSVERMTGIIGDLYSLLREHKVTHERDELFASHILNAVARPNERGFTISKGKSRGHIDAAIALGLAVDRVRNKAKPRPSVVVL